MSIPLGAGRHLTITVVSAPRGRLHAPPALVAAAAAATDAELARLGVRHATDIERARWEAAMLLRGLPRPQ